MTMLNRNLPWVKKYSIKSFNELKPGTITFYKYCQKIGRREYLRKSREKSARFEAKHPGNNSYRVFKHYNKNLSEIILQKAKEKIEKDRSIKGIKEFIKSL